MRNSTDIDLIRCEVCGAPFEVHFKGVPYCNKHYQRMRKHGTTELQIRKRRNTYTLDGDILRVTTSSGVEIIADAKDAESIKKYSWCISKTGYAVARIGNKTVKMHRYILELSNGDGSIVDHKNGNTLDNRRANLRVCTKRDNARNCKQPYNSKALHKGIRITPNGKYEARIMVDRETISLGRYRTLDEAIDARTQAEVRYYGEYAPSINRK